MLKRPFKPQREITAFFAKAKKTEKALVLF